MLENSDAKMTGGKCLCVCSNFVFMAYRCPLVDCKQFAVLLVSGAVSGFINVVSLISIVFLVKICSV